MSELEGVLRALSFIGLGAVLIGIGLFYQRLLTRAAKEGEDASCSSIQYGEYEYSIGDTQMPLYIRDDEPDALAVRLQGETNVRSKTEAVRIALLHELERSHARKPLRERIAVLQAQAAELGPDPNFDMKAFFGEAWED